MVSSIPESLVPVLLSMYGEQDPVLGRRRTYSDLVDWLKRKHGVTTSTDSVRRALKGPRAEAAEMRRDMLREQIAKTLPQQLETLDDLMIKAKEILRRKGVRAPQVLDVLDAYRKAVETKLRFGGITDALKDEDSKKVKLEGDADTLSAMLAKAFPRDP